MVDLVADRAAIIKQGQTPPPEMEQQILELISQRYTEIPLTHSGDVDWAAIETATAGMNTIPMQNAREVIRLLNANVIDPDLGEPALDVYNFHYHQTSSAMPAVAQYIQRVFDTDGSPHKTITAWWVQAYVSNIGITLDVDVSAQIAAGAHFYDMEGFEITPQNGTILVGFAPVFAERMHRRGNPVLIKP